MKRNKAKKLKAADVQRYREIKRKRREKRKSAREAAIVSRIRPLLVRMGQMAAEINLLRRQDQHAPVMEVSNEA